MATVNLAYWSEIMTNDLQVETMVSPEGKFEALQTGDGHSLLFSIGTDGTFYLAREHGGQSDAGWSVSDLSSAQMKKDFAGQSGVTCRTFGAGQSAQNGSVGLAMVIGAGDGDHLYLCLGNSSKDISWVDAPNWASYEYDGRPFKLEIVDVFFCETVEKTQYIVVDIVRDPQSAVKEVSRYHIDPEKKGGHYWNKQDLAVDIEVDDYDSCPGRARKGYVDGLYTVGHAGAVAQLTFCPLINAFGDGPPLPVRLNLPGGIKATAIAASRNADQSTDLFASSGNTLYYFSSANQAEGAVGAVLMTKNVLLGTSKLSIMQSNGVVTLCGLNAFDQVYYTSCPQLKVSDPSAWSAPGPIFSGIEKMCLHVNGVGGGNTLFVCGEGRLQRITQDAGSISKRWQSAEIIRTLRPISFKVTIKVTDDQNALLKDAPLSLSANNRTVVYINGEQRSVDQTPIHISSNSLGFVTIVEPPGTPISTTFTLSSGSGAAVTINPDDPKKTYTVCFAGTACTRDEGERTRDTSDKKIYSSDTGYIPVRIHKEISGSLEATGPSVTVRGAGENDWNQPRNNSEPLVFNAPLQAPGDLLKYIKNYSGGDQLSTGAQIDGWGAPALALHGANLAAASGTRQFNFIGHSRGAVECIMAAWFLYAYGRRDVFVNIFAIDPVPGTGQWYGILTQLPPNVANYVGVYSWDQCVQPLDKPFSALVPRPNSLMIGQLENLKLGNGWDGLGDNYQLADPLAPSNAPQPQGYELYACRGRHGTVAGITTADGKYDPSTVSASVAPVPELIYKLARAYLTKWGTHFQTRSGVEESTVQLRRKINTDHAKFDSMGGGATRTSSVPYRPYVRRVSSILGRNPFETYYMDDVVGDPPYTLAYPVTNERKDTGWVKWKFL